MKQVYAAGTAADRPAVRAASAGVRPDELDAVLAAAGPLAPADAERVPVRLALLATPAGRQLVHVAPLPGGGRVAHALVGVPASADAHSAVQTWGSPQWQRQPPDAVADLPELPYLPVADALDDDGLRRWLSTPARRDLLEFALAALLATPDATRVVVNAPADDVVWLVYAVTRGLPGGLLEEFTFSTSEADPAATAARLVGTDPGRPLDDALFAAGGGFVAFDPAGNRKSELPPVPFAGFAADAVAAGEFHKLDDLRALWQRLGLTDAKLFDLVYRLGRGAGVLTQEEAAEAVRQPALAAWLSARTDAVHQLLDWALDDRAFASDSFSRVVQGLRQRPEVLAKLGQTVRDRGVQALRDGDIGRTSTALEVVLPMVAPTKAGGVWADLLSQLSDPDALPGAVRGYLLPKFARSRQQAGVQGVDPALARWLSVPTAKLGELLELDLPRAYHLAAGRACLLRPGEPTDELARTLGAYPPLALSLLRPEAADDAHAVGLFDKLLKEVPSTAWAEEAVAAGDDYPAATRGKFLDAALAADAVDADRLVRTRGPRVLELFAGQAGLDRLGAKLLADPPADLLRAAPLTEFLDKLHAEPAVGDAVKARIAAVRAAREFLHEPGFTADRLTAAAAALRLAPAVVPASAKGETFDAVVAALSRRADEDGFQADLEAVLLHLGGVLATGPADLCENLLRELRGRTDLSRRPGPTTAFLAVSLGAAQTPELANKLDGLDGPAFALAADAARRGGGKLLAEIDRRAADWPAPARAQWGFLRAAVRPAGLGRAVRDVLFFAAGAGAASLAWFVVAWVLR